MAYTDRAKKIIEGLLGKVPNQNHLAMAGKAFWDTDPYGIKRDKYKPTEEGWPTDDTRPLLPDDPSAEEQAEILVESLKTLTENYLKQHAKETALADLSAQIDAKVQEEDFFAGPAPLPPLDELFTGGIPE